MRTKINDRNWAVTMGRINTFFKKSVKEDCGIGMVLNTEDYIYDEESGEFNEVPKYTEQRIFKAYPGRCKKHFLYQNYLDKRKEGSCILVQEKNNTRIALSTAHSTSCVPISIGDIVELSSNKLVIKHKDFFSTQIFYKNFFTYGNYKRRTCRRNQEWYIRFIILVFR